MFKSINLNCDSITFESHNANQVLTRPSHVSPSQWYSLWNGFEKIYKTNDYSLNSFVEQATEVLEKELEYLSNDIDDLRDEVRVLEIENRSLEKEIDELKSELSRWD